MDMRRKKRQAIWSWLFVCALLALCGVLGVRQYHWIGEVTVSARDRLRGTLQASLVRTGLDFSAELTAACGAVLPPGPFDDAKDLLRQIPPLYLEWKKSARQTPAFRRIALAVPGTRAVQLEMLDLERGVFEPAEW